MPRPARRPRVTDAQRDHAAAVYEALEQLYPDARCALDHRNPFELLVATILSAQCTDKRVNLVTPALFAKYPTPAAMSNATPPALEALIRTTGFFRNKARSILGAARQLAEHHRGRVPATMAELLQLPGVARKTANVVLGNAFNRNEGVVVDTHVQRLARRLRLTRLAQPVKIEQDLIARFPPHRWTMLSHLLIAHGRAVCVARKPRCAACTLAPICPKVGVSAPPPRNPSA